MQRSEEQEWNMKGMSILGNTFQRKRSSDDNNDNKDQDRFLPVANVGRIMKKVIPGNGKISKDAKETIKECVSEFISFVTGEASDKCQREKRKTINGDDIIWAITSLGFEDYVVPLKLYLNRYRENEGKKLNNNHVPNQEEQQQLISSELPEQSALANFQPNHFVSSSASSTPLLSHPNSFDHHQQTFSFPFSPPSFQTQFQQQDQIDSVGHW